jgi:hypothetical protein
MYTLFDKVCLIYEGQMVYYGPMESAVQYFIDMGYEPQNRQTSADFLVAVTDPNGRFVREGFESVVPRSAVEFAEYFAKSEIGRRNVKAVDDETKKYSEDKLVAYRASARAERAQNMSPKSSYLISYPMQIKLAMVRRFQMQMADLPTLAIISIAAIFQSLIIGESLAFLSDASMLTSVSFRFGLLPNGTKYWRILPQRRSHLLCCKF